MWPTAKRKKRTNLPRTKPDNLTGKFFALLLSGLILSGCVATTTDVDRLQDSLNHVQKSQADLIAKMDNLDHAIGALSEKLSDSQKNMSALSLKLDDAQASLGQRMEIISRLLSEATSQA